MSDSSTTSQTSRLPYLIKIGLIVIGFMIFIPVVSAETVKLLENTDICEYRPKLDMDYCYSKYEVCDSSLSDVEKSIFVFQDEKSGYKDDLNSLYFNNVSVVDKGQCKELTITAYKSPFKNIDNVLCTLTKCYYEHVWWNRSFLFKYPVNASTSSGSATLPVLLNDSNVTINGFAQHIWCNYSVNSTRRVVGYLYFTNESFYRCVDETETFSVLTNVDEGNGTSFGTPEEDLILWLHLNGTDGFDSSRYARPLVATGGNPVQADGQIAHSVEFRTAGTDEWLSYGDINETDGISTITYMGWTIVKADDQHSIISKSDNNIDTLLGYVTAGQFFFVVNVGGTDYYALADIGDWDPDVKDRWLHIAGTYDGETVRLYINGVEEATNTDPSGVISSTGIDVRIGKHSGSAGQYDAKGPIDEARIYNRTLSSDEIMSIYNNTVGTHDFAPLGPAIARDQNTSILGASFDILDFSFSTTEFTPGFNATFTLEETADMVLISSMNIEKISGGGTNVVSIRVSLDSSVILSEDMRTVTGIGDIGAVVITPTIFTSTSGEHNITYEFKKTGPGTISITNIDAILLQNISNLDNSIRMNTTPAIYNHSDVSFISAFNWTIPKVGLSRTYYTIKQTVTKITSGTSTLSYFFEDFSFNHTSPLWQRILADATDVGSIGGVFMDDEESGNLNYTIQSRQTDVGDTVSVNGTILDIDMLDSDGGIIQAFQESNDLTNLTDSITLVAGTHNIANVTISLIDGNAYFLSMMSSFSSASGAQTPEYFINSSNSSATCTSSKQRFLSNSDIGNAVIYLLCENLTTSSDYIFNLYVTVAAGESINQIDESFNGFEITTFALIVLNLPPIASEITNPTNGSNVSGSDTITWTAFFDPNADILTYNVTLLNVSGIHNTTIGVTNSTSLSVNWNSFALGFYFLQVEGCDPGGLCDDVNISIRIVTPPTPELQPNIRFCEDADIFRTETNTRTITDGVTSDEREITRTVCQYGCSNETWVNFGTPGCIESPMLIYIIIGIILFVSAYLLIRFGGEQ